MTLARDITFKQIRAFAAVVRTGSITKAAEELCVTPPAISVQIKALKMLAGVAVLNRDKDGLTPTPAGQELLDLYGRIQASVQTASHKIDAIKSGKSGTIGVAVVSTGKYFAPTIFAEFIKAYPDIELRPLIGNRQIVLGALRDKSVDMAIMGRPPAKLDVVAHELGEHPFVLIVAPNHPLAKKTKIKAEDLMAETLLTRELGSGTRTLAIRFMDKVGLGMGYDSMETGSNESIKQSVMAGLGIALISEHTVMAELAQKRLVALDFSGLPILRKWI
ncbi:MAG TPA: LysR family transcriptional regulator, partial [Hellea balneolensis]|nr:LysR family transcriptional regulator [Hellea balneolensis]